MNSEDDEFARIEREAKLRQVPLPAKIYDYEEAYFALKAKRALAVPDPIYHTDISEAMEYIQGWNDCRAAMLAALPAQQAPVPWSQALEDVWAEEQLPPDGYTESKLKEQHMNYEWIERFVELARVDERAKLAEQPAQTVSHAIIAGALFDFMGWLTSRKERLVLSSVDEASPAVDAIRDFAKMRGLFLDDAKVQDWHTTPQAQRPWVGLTDEERDRIWSSYRVSFVAIDHIESKLKEKNT